MTLAEAMDLIDEENRTSPVCRSKETAIDRRIAFRFVYHVSYFLHAARHGTQRIERSLELMRDDTGKGGLSYTRRAPQDETGDITALYHLAQDCSFADQVFLTYVIV